MLHVESPKYNNVTLDYPEKFPTNISMLCEYFERPNHAECSLWLYMICQQEERSIDMACIDRTVTMFGCDLRACLNFLQFWTLPSVAPNLPLVSNQIGVSDPFYLELFTAFSSPWDVLFDNYLHEYVFINSITEVYLYLSKFHVKSH